MIPETPEPHLEQAKNAIEALNKLFQPLADKIPVNTEMAIVFNPGAAE